MPIKITKVVPASKDRVKALQAEVRKVLEVIGYPTAWVTDQSMIGDFPLDIDDARIAGAELGVELSLHDYVVDVAQRLQEKSP